jgi:ribosome-interacting GTPase 1
MNAPLPEERLAEIKELLFKGQKIEAIKRHREWTGTGLAEAKGAVEEIEKGLRQLSPEKFSPAASGKGCLGLVLLICVALTLLLVRLINR